MTNNHSVEFNRETASGQKQDSESKERACLWSVIMWLMPLRRMTPAVLRLFDKVVTKELKLFHTSVRRTFSANMQRICMKDALMQTFPT